MAGLRPFRGLRYAGEAGALSSLLSPAAGVLTPAERESYAVRNPYNAIHLSSPEGSGDDRSKYVRYARSAASLADWRRLGLLAPEKRPSFYRLTQSFADEVARVTLLAVADFGPEIRSVESVEVKAREDRLRLLEATRTAFEPATAFYEDPQGELLKGIKAAPSSSETMVTLDGVTSVLETIDDPDVLADLARAFSPVPLYVADGGDAFEAARAFREDMGTRTERVSEDGVFVALASLDDPAYVRIAVHRVLRRLPGGLEATLAKLSTRFAVEEHHNRNLAPRIDAVGGPAFGMATEGGLGFLLVPNDPIKEPAALWLDREILQGLLATTANDATLSFTDPLQAIRAADEGAAAAFILPRPAWDDLRRGLTLPHRSAATFPAVPTGLVFWSMGDDV